MEMTISADELRTRKIFIATPMYGGMCAGMYTKSTADLAMLASSYDMDIRFFYLFNESLITRARNYLADEFLRSDCTHLMFIDADIGFDPHDVISLAALADPEGDKEIICGPYPKKCISWEKIKRAVDKGFGDKDPNNLENYVGDFVFNPAEGTTEIAVSEPVEVLEGGTGFMMIRRSAFEKYAKAYPHLSYLPDHVRTDHFDGSREIFAFFDCVIDRGYTNDRFHTLLQKAADGENIEQASKELIRLEKKSSKRYLSEDYMFCQYARDAGIKVWLCPWMKLSHMGSYVFAGSLADLAALGVSATADIDMIGKRKKLGDDARLIPK